MPVAKDRRNNEYQIIREINSRSEDGEGVIVSVEEFTNDYNKAFEQFFGEQVSDEGDRLS